MKIIYHGEVLDGLALGDGVGNLHGQDGFAQVGIGKEDAHFAAAPEIAKQGGFGYAGGAGLQPLGGGFDDEGAGTIGRRQEGVGLRGPGIGRRWLPRQRVEQLEHVGVGVV